MNRIAIVGNSGAGKSIFAKKLGIKLNIKVFHLDNLYHLSEKSNKNPSSWDNVQNRLVLVNKWIIDGNFPRTWHIRFKFADTIIFFDFPILLSLFRVLYRRIRYNKTGRPDMPIGVKERLRFRDIKKILFFPKPELLIKKYKLNSKRIIIFKNNYEANKFLNSI